ncbi:hypothetical protein DL764_008777 [Monosporascus ibericus]|uniref:Uncharacterized protein n=1 Tax=Monosporascus ibericus TaxID=155417 RepID=A0A4Q4SYW2_9PEZI|nr:hypothetical protein DL764_008777 [Monosporascus ibericus]
MASTAVHYLVDKDRGQLTSSYWPDNDELGAASDNFFDQFVTFDAGDAAAAAGLTAEDLLEGPPSPSILIDSLKDDLANSSSNDQDRRHLSGSSQLPPAAAEPVDGVTGPIEISPREAAAAENISCAPADLLSVLTGDPILGGSISDSELLRLEGISLRSPRTNLTAPSSLPLGSPSSLKPRKHSRFVESVYATIRRAAHHRPPKLELGDGSGGGNPQQHMASMAMNAFETTVTKPRNRLYHPQNHHHQHHNCHHGQYADPRIKRTQNGRGLEAIKHEPVDNDGLPLSPPLTGTVPTPGMRFVSGHLDDPFCEDGLRLPAHSTTTTTTIQSQIQGQDTLMHTPDIHDVFYQQAMAAVEHANNAAAYGRQQQQQQPKQQRHSGRTAEWPMDGLLTAHENLHLWSSASPSAAVYIPDGGSRELLPTSPEWWATRHHQQISSLHLNSNGNSNPQDHGREHQQAYEYDAADGLSGLMIHMPRPRQPPPAVLSATDLNDPAAATLSSSPPSSSARVPISNGNSFPMPTPSSSASHRHHQQPRYHDHHAAHTPQQQQQQQQHYHHHPGYTEQQRRPRPRAPSSGARHHGSMTSPRKLHHSSSRPYLVLREESTSPTPTRHHGQSPHARSSYQQQPRSASSTISVRKRRSWCKRTATGSGSATSTTAAEPRTPSSSSTTFNNNNTNTGGGGGGRGRSSSAGGCGAVDFVNFTPSDKNVLMTGVAPSGSSKTKARREREALDRQRKLSEATIRAVREAGGDVDKFIEQGFWLGGQAR